MVGEYTLQKCNKAEYTGANVQKLDAFDGPGEIMQFIMY